MTPALIAIEWGGAAFAAAGTVLLAMNGPRAGIGFVLYLASNACWIYFARTAHDTAILAQNLVFVASALLGVWKWLIAPRRRTFLDVYRCTRPYRTPFAAARVALRCSRTPTAQRPPRPMPAPVPSTAPTCSRFPAQPLLACRRWARADLTAQEAAIVLALGSVWDDFLELPVEHAQDAPEFCEGVHRLQEKVLARAGRRDLNGTRGAQACPDCGEDHGDKGGA